MFYAAMGDDEKAMQYMALGYVNDLKNWPHLKSIRSSPIFIEVVEHLEEVCSQEYNRIGILLNRNRHNL